MLGGALSDPRAASPRLREFDVIRNSDAAMSQDDGRMVCAGWLGPSRSESPGRGQSRFLKNWRIFGVPCQSAGWGWGICVT